MAVISLLFVALLLAACGGDGGGGGGGGADLDGAALRKNLEAAGYTVGEANAKTYFQGALR
jgi:hypothetical protein